MENVRASAADSARRLAAAVSGAIEGFVEALEEYDLANEAKIAAQEGTAVASAAIEESRTLGQTPEMQQVGGYLKTAGTATAGAVRSAKDSVVDTTSGAYGAVKDRTSSAAESVRESVESAKLAATRLKEETKVRGQAVAESGRRARQAPGQYTREVKGALGAWMGGLTRALAMFALIGVVGVAAFVLLTISLVVWFNILVGDPLGTFLVFLLYVVVAGIAFAIARSQRAKARAETQRHMENSREVIRNVGRPVREAFGRGRAGI